MPAAEYRPASSLSSSTSTSTSTLVSDSSLPQNSRMDDQQFVTTFFCRAKYDYQSADDASLSFRRGDIIEVLTRLDTGWWDGLLGEERGWFPSNYVDIISDEEADIGLAALELQQQQQQQQQPNVQLMPTFPLSTSQSTSTQSSLARSSMAQSRLHNDQRTWPDGDTDPSSRNGHGVDGPPPITSVGGDTAPNDYWVPRVNTDGQVSRSPPLSLPRLIYPLMTITCCRYTTSTPRRVNALETFPLMPMATSRMSISAPLNACGQKSP